jgi:hypothetical protein
VVSISTLLMISTDVSVRAPAMVSNCGIAAGVATGSVKGVESTFVAMKLTVLGSDRFSSGSSISRLFVHFERGLRACALREFCLSLWKENALIFSSCESAYLIA